MDTKAVFISACKHFETLIEGLSFTQSVVKGREDFPREIFWKFTDSLGVTP